MRASLYFYYLHTINCDFVRSLNDSVKAFYIMENIDM